MDNKKLKVVWLSAGVSSFIAGYLIRDTIDQFIYIDVKDQHPDSLRFIYDCENILGKKILILKSEEYEDVEDACTSEGIIRHAKNGYAPCTALLKKLVRKRWEKVQMLENGITDITYVWGFDLDEKHREERLVNAMPEFKHEFPLIDRELSKQDAHAISYQLGIKRPIMYDLGYNNNNCIGCIKGGMGYWNKIRIDFPEVFERRSKLERKLNSRILKECFLDELDPNRGNMSEEIMQDCGIYCMLNLENEEYIVP